MTAFATDTVEALFAAALARSPAERDALLAAAAATDAERDAARALLLAHDRMGDFLESPLISADDEADSLVGRRLGPFQLHEVIGTGGMGVVYRARQAEPERIVAVKVLRSDLPPADARRILREAGILARLRHPHIAQVHVAGRIDGDAGSRAYFAMELVDGASLLDHAAGLALESRLALFVAICNALQHAHESGVIHRDLKPGNIRVDTEGRPKVLDFGIAIATDPALRSTEIGLRGTLAYMSPEQLRSGELDARTDVYSLGAVLYELLSGRPPLHFAQRSLVAEARAIEEEEPVALGALDPQLRGDLEAIAACALAKDRERRYRSAAALADDVERHLRGLPIQARMPGAWYRTTKFVNRHRVPVASLIVLAVALGALTFLVNRTAGIRRDAEQRDRARRLELNLNDGYRVMLGAREDSIRRFEAILANEPESVEAAVGLLLSFNRLRQPELGVARFDALPPELRASPPVRRTLATLLHVLNREEESRRQLAEVGPPRDAFEMFVEATRLLAVPKPFDPEPADRRAARQLLGLAVQRAPAARLLYHCALANAVALARDRDECDAMAATLESLWPHESVAWFWIGYLVSDYDKPRQIAAYRHAIRLQPDLGPAWTNLGLALRDSGRLVDARAAAETATRVDPRSHVAWSNFGTVLGDLAEWDAAERAFRDAIRLRWDYIYAWDGLARAGGATHDDELELDASLRSYEIRPDVSGGVFNLGVCYDERGRYDDALGCFELTIRADPTHWQAHSRRAGVLWKLGRKDAFESAMACWRAVRMNRGLAWGDYGIYLLLTPELGRPPEEALDSVQRSIALTPYDDTDLLEALAVALEKCGRIEEAGLTLDYRDSLGRKR